MKFLYKIPGYILLLFGGFCLSWGGLIIRSFEEASVWQILFIRSFFFLIALIFFLLLIYKKNTLNIIKESGLPGLLGGFVLSFSFVAFVVAMSNTSVANVVFIISTQTLFLAIFGYFYLKEKVSLIGFISIFLALSGILIMVGDSISTSSFFGNVVALAIPLNFAFLVMIIRKNTKVDMVPAIFYSGVFSLIYGFFLAESFHFTKHDLWMGFCLCTPVGIGLYLYHDWLKKGRVSNSWTLNVNGDFMCTNLGMVFLNEIPPFSVFIGGAIIVLAIILKSFDKRNIKA